VLSHQWAGPWLSLALSVLIGCAGDTADDDDGDDDTDDDATDDDDDTDDDDAGDDDTGLHNTDCRTLTVTEGQFVLLGIAVGSGAYTEVGRWGQELALGATGKGITMYGNQLIVPAQIDGQSQWVALDVPGDEIWMGAITEEISVASDEGDLIVRCKEDDLCRYGTYQFLNLGLPSGSINIDVHDGRFTIEDGLLYNADPVEPTIDVYDLQTATYLHTIVAEDWGGFTDGIGVLGDHLFLLRASDEHLSEFARFDLGTGAWQDSHEIESQGYESTPNGLWCWAY